MDSLTNALGHKLLGEFFLPEWFSDLMNNISSGLRIYHGRNTLIKKYPPSDNMVLYMNKYSFDHSVLLVHISNVSGPNSSKINDNIYVPNHIKKVFFVLCHGNDIQEIDAWGTARPVELRDYTHDEGHLISPNNKHNIKISPESKIIISDSLGTEKYTYESTIGIGDIAEFIDNDHFMVYHDCTEPIGYDEDGFDYPEIYSTTIVSWKDGKTKEFNIPVFREYAILEDNIIFNNYDQSGYVLINFRNGICEEILFSSH